MDVDNSKFVAGGGTTTMAVLGTVGLGYSLLNGGNGLGGLLGGGPRLAEAEAKIAKLEAERYTDAATIATQAREAELRALEVKNAEAIAALKKEYDLRVEIERQKAKIELLEAVNPLTAQLASTQTSLVALQQVVGGFTKPYILSSAVAPATATASAGA